MAEAVAAFYAVETALEAAAVGAFTVSKATVPLHVRFHKIKSPSPSLDRTSHSLNVLKGKAYIFGGDLSNGTVDDTVRVITLPNDPAFAVDGNEVTDYQLVKPVAGKERPLEGYRDVPRQGVDSEGFEEVNLGGSDNASKLPGARAAHSTTSIDGTIYVIAGRGPRSKEDDDSSDLQQQNLFNCDVVYAFDTLTHDWTALPADQQKSTDGVPCPRTHASCSSSPHPAPGAGPEATVNAHGTIFLHGGYDSQGKLLRDTWTFDVGSRTWSLWPCIPDPAPEEIAAEGNIIYTNGRLWRASDGFGKMVYLDLVERDVGDTSNRSFLGVGLKSGKWEVLSFGEKAADHALQGQVGARTEKTLTDKSEQLPVPRQGAGLLPITTGAGREYLLYFMGEEGHDSTLRDLWSFQIHSDSKTPALLKDSIRDMVGKSSGENQWAPCEVVESTKDDGPIETPAGLSRFASDTWADLGGASVVIWGGRGGDGEVKNEGWILTIE